MKEVLSGLQPLKKTQHARKTVLFQAAETSKRRVTEYSQGIEEMSERAVHRLRSKMASYPHHGHQPLVIGVALGSQLHER